MAKEIGRDGLSIELHQIGSEDFVPEPGSVDLCFTSPPYFDCEKYSNDAEQSYIRYPTREKWQNEFLGRTLRNCRTALHTFGFLVVNIASVDSYPTLEDDFVRLATSYGFCLLGVIQLRLSSMPGQGNGHKHEPIFVFAR
jgi:DNA modification methylase